MLLNLDTVYAGGVIKVMKASSLVSMEIFVYKLSLNSATPLVDAGTILD